MSDNSRTVYGWVTPSDVQAHLALAAVTPTDTARLGKACDATNSLIRKWRPDLEVPNRETIGPFSAQFSPQFSGTEGTGWRQEDWAVREGATRLAAAMFNTINNQGGDFAQFADLGSPALSGILDATIQALLGIGRHHEPLVG